MIPHDLKEFAQLLRIKGDYRETEFADEILELIDLESEVAEPYSNLCADLDHAAPKELQDKPDKALEWLVDRSHKLTEIEGHFEKVDMSGDVDDLTRQVLNELKSVETVMREHGGWTKGDLQDALFALVERAGKIENDLEYDL